MFFQIFETKFKAQSLKHFIFLATILSLPFAKLVVGSVYLSLFTVFEC